MISVNYSYLDPLVYYLFISKHHMGAVNCCGVGGGIGCCGCGGPAVPLGASYPIGGLSTANSFGAVTPTPIAPVIPLANSADFHPATYNGAYCGGCCMGNGFGAGCDVCCGAGCCGGLGSGVCGVGGPVLCGPNGGCCGPLFCCGNATGIGFCGNGGPPGCCVPSQGCGCGLAPGGIGCCGNTPCCGCGPGGCGYGGPNCIGTCCTPCCGAAAHGSVQPPPHWTAAQGPYGPHSSPCCGFGCCW